MHTHHRQDESFTIVSSTMAYQILGQEVQYAHPGETVLIKAGIPHKFSNPGNEVLKVQKLFNPS
jgi:mannose-6-phosphate isomerase-like protein (cupin superfamily)